MLNNLSRHPQRRLQYALAIAGLIAGVSAVITFALIAPAFLMAGVHYSQHPFAMFMPHVNVVPSRMPYGVLAGAAWLLLPTLYAGLLVGIPALFTLYLGWADAN